MKKSKYLLSYGLSDAEIDIIKDVYPLLKENMYKFSDNFSQHILSFDHAKAFLKTNEIIELHKVKISEWFDALFAGVYDHDYFSYLEHINNLHRKIGLPAHYVNVSMNYIRRFIHRILIENEKYYALESVDKIVDINLEILSTNYSGEDQEQLLETIRIVRRAIENDYVVPYAQGIFDSKTRKIKRYECLCRIEDPENGLVMPGKFLEVAKRVHLYKELTHIMAKKSFAAFEGADFGFTLNLTFSDISDAETSAFILELMNKFSRPENVIIELVETEEVTDIEKLYGFCEEIRKIGGRIAIDDFGSGYSNYEHIKNISPDFIKIDGSLIKDIDTNQIAQTMVESIIDFSRRLKISVVAEYVHNESVLNKIVELDIESAQGFFLAKPEPLSKIFVN